MNKVTNKILSLIMSVVMVLSIISIPINAAESTTNTEKTVTVTIERFTVGQGFLVTPVNIEMKEGDTVASVFEKAAALKGITYPDASSDYGFYLNSINNADAGVIDIPAEISAMPDIVLWDQSVAKAPTNEENSGNFYENNGLGTGSYHTMSGWMFTLNNEDTGASADAVLVKAGDVIRCQFSLYGYGADIGFDTESFTGVPKVVLANKGKLIKEVATVAENSAMLKDAAVQTAYNEAMTLLEVYNAEQVKVDEVLAKLQKTEKDYLDKTQNINPEPEPVKVKVAQGKVKKIKNVKGLKAKITIKKLSGITKYQYCYANNKKFKKATVKNTKKTSLTTKKFKKKQRCYVKVRAYKSVKGVKHYGKWSAKKSVKIKK